jgi:hypothetical protein
MAAATTGGRVRHRLDRKNVLAALQTMAMSPCADDYGNAWHYLQGWLTRNGKDTELNLAFERINNAIRAAKGQPQRIPDLGATRPAA